MADEFELWSKRRKEQREGHEALALPLRPRTKASVATLVGTSLSTTPLVQYDPRTSTRSRRHQQLVSIILNSLIQRKELQLDGAVTWVLGYDAGNKLSWAGANPPATITDALDRLAALLKTLNGGVGP